VLLFNELSIHIFNDGPVVSSDSDEVVFFEIIGIHQLGAKSGLVYI
jgi:hypothetical protein